MNKLTMTSYIYNNHNCFSFTRQSKKEFIISFQNNLDLYFAIKKFNNDPTFIIGKDNYQIYQLFNDLYNDIKNCKIDENNNTFENLRETIIHQELFHNNKIEWISDDYPKEIAPSFTIEKKTNSFLIKFTKIKDEWYYLVPEDYIAVRLSNSGSYYYPFNIIFMKLYFALSSLNEEYHQIHIEEYLLDEEIKEKSTSLKKILLRKI